MGVTRTYLDTPRASEVLAGLKAGAIAEMSYAYDVTKWDYEIDGKDLPIRNIYTANLLDVSDVNLGMNPASADKPRTSLLSQTSTVLLPWMTYQPL